VSRGRWRKRRTEEEEEEEEKEERVVMRVMMRREGQIPCVIIAWRNNLPLSQTCRDNLPL
jgi:hypothetical protein